MAVVCDTGAVYALYDADDEHHPACKAVVENERGPLFLPAILLVEIDYLLTTRLGVDASVEFLESIESGAFNLVQVNSEDLGVVARSSCSIATCLSVLRMPLLWPSLSVCKFNAFSRSISVTFEPSNPKASDI